MNKNYYIIWWNIDTPQALYSKNDVVVFKKYRQNTNDYMFLIEGDEGLTLDGLISYFNHKWKKSKTTIEIINMIKEYKQTLRKSKITDLLNG